ncbi:MAG TPA: hypothetical protein VFW98_08290 [Gemmatimonadaceae bacterium]|nr:hypothetical protein [Gemmatimonadaceae bacterium]
MFSFVTAHWLALAGMLVLAMVVLALIGRRQYGWTAADSASILATGVHDAYWYHVLVALDCFVNALCGGMVGETISARCGRWALAVRGHGTGWHWLASFMCAWLDVIQPDHGQRAIVGALARARLLTAVEHDALARIELAPHPVTSPVPTPAGAATTPPAPARPTAAE